MKINNLKTFRIILPVRIILILYIALFSSKAYTQHPALKNVLYINSYGITYSWGDSVAKGITGVFAQHSDIQLYIEYLDSKRLGNSYFTDIYRFLKTKYKHIKFDVAIVSDNDALDFISLYGDSLIPAVPVVFCGVNNPEDYSLEQSRFYGIKEGVDQDSVNQLILKIIPGIKKLYFLFDKTTTSLVNMKYIKALEHKYVNKVEFVYIYDLSIDSLFKLVPTFDKGNAIALIDIFQDKNLTPVHSDVIAQKIANISPVPIFIDSETSFGKGILGGIFNKGTLHGKEAAALALKFIYNPDFKPEVRVTLPRDRYFFDYNVLVKYNLNENLLPNGSVIINKPSSLLKKYLLYIFVLLLFVGLLIVIIFYLIININRRKGAEHIVKQKLGEINDQNLQLEEANQIVNNMNAELEDLNDHLSQTNKALIEAKQKAEESDKLKSSFLANMSHEIRTPLNAIVGFSTLTADTSLSDSDREYYGQIIKSNSDQLLNLIDDILDFSKIEAGQLQITNELFSVQDIYTELCTSANQNNIKKTIEIRMASFVKKNHMMLRSDPLRFKQVLLNLISNAIKFTNKGYIELGYLINEKNIPVFYVKDTGIGIEPAYLDHVFDRFWKYEGHNNKLYSGAGLGLAICKKLCGLLGGDIWVESESAKGTTFYFSIPRLFFMKEESTKTKNITKVKPHTNWQAFTVAIAEDEEYNLQYLVEALKHTKIKVLCFTNGSEIVHYFENNSQHQVDLVLMDIKMPKMDGFEALQRIKEIDPQLAIIAQTAYAMVSDLKRIKASHFDDFITKPIKAPVLIEKMEAFLVKK